MPLSNFVSDEKSGCPHAAHVNVPDRFSSFSGLVLTFTQYALAPASNFTATINWGDGTTPSTGTVAAGQNGQFTVRGVHKVTTALLWFALANNILAGHRLQHAQA